MIAKIIKILGEYGWPALLLFLSSGFLINYLRTRIPQWNSRETEKQKRLQDAIKDEIRNHQFFSNLKFRMENEIPFLPMDDTKPIRQKAFRKILELKLLTLKETVEIIISADVHNKTPSQWASFVISEIHKGDDRLHQYALENGLPVALIRRFMMWQQRSIEILISYVNDLAVSDIYNTDTLRLNTILYMFGLQLSTIVGDAEKSVTALNGEISGLTYNGEILE